MRRRIFSSEVQARSVLAITLCITRICMRDLIALLIVFSVSAIAQAQQQPNAPVSQPTKPADVDDSLRSFYPNLPPTQDPAAVARGKELFGANCAFCHGKEATGGNSGPDLIRSVMVNQDEKGELVGPMIRQGKTSKGMPGFNLPDSQISDLVAFLHQRNRDARLRFTYKIPNVAVGNAAAGKIYFDTHCAPCHVTSHNLAGIGSKYQADELQQRWLDPGGPPPAIAVTVSLPNGQKYSGELKHRDEFGVSLYDAQGNYRSFPLGPETKVEIQDPLEGHRKLLQQLGDADIHNVTTYLETLK